MNSITSTSVGGQADDKSLQTCGEGIEFLNVEDISDLRCIYSTGKFKKCSATAVILLNSDNWPPALVVASNATSIVNIKVDKVALKCLVLFSNVEFTSSVANTVLSCDVLFVIDNISIETSQVTLSAKQVVNVCSSFFINTLLIRDRTMQVGVAFEFEGKKTNLVLQRQRLLTLHKEKNQVTKAYRAYLEILVKEYAQSDQKLISLINDKTNDLKGKVRGLNLLIANKALWFEVCFKQFNDKFLLFSNMINKREKAGVHDARFSRQQLEAIRLPFSGQDAISLFNTVKV